MVIIIIPLQLNYLHLPVTYFFSHYVTSIRKNYIDLKSLLA